MSLATQTTNPAIVEWARSCPDPSLFVSELVRHAYLNGKIACNQCGEKKVLKDCRYDEAYWVTGELICRDCWDLRGG